MVLTCRKFTFLLLLCPALTAHHPVRGPGNKQRIPAPVECLQEHSPLGKLEGNSGLVLSIAAFSGASQVLTLCVGCYPLSVRVRKEEQCGVVVKNKGAAGIQLCAHHFPAVLL